MQQSTEKTGRKKSIVFYIGGAVIILIAIVILFMLSSTKKTTFDQDASRRADEVAAGPLVQTASVIMSPEASAIAVEGDAIPYASTTLFAKIGGYLKTIRVDKGDNVKQGQLLATIESPETDQQYQSAVVDAANKQKIAERNQQLLAKDLISPEAAEQSIADAQIAKQTLAVDKTQKDYEIITAPFTGKIVSRYVDPGALIQNAVNQATTTQPIVAVAQVDRLRVDIYVDQRYAAYVHVGDPVDITLPDRPGFVEHASITRFSGELDPQTRMQLVEIEVPNKTNAIVPWSTVVVTLKVDAPAFMQIPASALIVRKDKYFVPVVDQNHIVTLRPVQIGRNNGVTVEILDGLTGQERIGLNVGQSVQDGQRVQTVSANKSS